ncbi:MAG: type III pantothenate kinase [Gammaproteobacteria bacterium]|nr:type III pantothenate kinase [Gammaproteobacteria bacterium]
MKLLLDLGNTSLKWALHDGSAFCQQGFVPHANANAADLAKALVAAVEAAAPGTAVETCAVAAVHADEWHGAIAAAVREHFGADAWFASVEREALGVSCAYPEPGRLGVDRWLAILAAKVLGRDLASERSGALVVDCGSAITIDLLAGDGRHRGGQITAGIEMMRRALSSNTQRIPEQERMEGLISSLADNTRDAVAAGTHAAALGFVQQAIDRAVASESPGRVLLTGGDAPLLLPELVVPETVQLEHRPLLVLEGLLALAEVRS